MSKEIYLIGIEYKSSELQSKMKAAFDSCRTLGLNPPDEVIQFFGGKTPPADLKHEIGINANVFENTTHDGLIINVRDIPDNVETLKFMVAKPLLEME